MRPYTFILAGMLICTALIGCAPPPPNPTPFPTYTSFPTQTATATPTITPTPPATATATQTPTPLPPSACTPGNKLESAVDNSLPGYIDIVNVSTRLRSRTLTVTFTMSWIPTEITIDRSILSFGAREVAWGVAIDADNDPSTGGASFFSESGYGYEYILQSLNYKQGEELTDEIENLFRGKTSLWQFYPGGFDIALPAKIDVDPAKSSITLSANIAGITADSYLHFFAIYFPIDNKQIADELCKR